MSYNGHKNWNHWNVSLWINNDESLYRLASNCVHGTDTLAEAAAEFLAEMEEAGTRTTPDGAPYSLSSIRAAMRGMER